MGILLIRILRFFLIVLYGLEFTSFTYVAYETFDICLLTISMGIAFASFLGFLMVCEIFDDVFGIESFVSRRRRMMLIMKVLLVLSMAGVVWSQYQIHPRSLNLIADVYLVVLIETVIFMITQLKKHKHRSLRRIAK